jgi:hypothetical protein
VHYPYMLRGGYRIRFTPTSSILHYRPSRCQVLRLLDL